MRRSQITNGMPKLPTSHGTSIPVHLPKSPQLPQAPMLQVAPISIEATLDSIEAIGRGRAMDFKVMVLAPDGSQVYVEGQTDK